MMHECKVLERPTAQRVRVSDGNILRAVRRCIDAKGPAGLTLAEVARDAGLTRMQVYNRFGSREALILALLVSHAERFNESVAERIAQAPSAGEGIVTGMLEAIRAGREDKYFALLVGPATSGRGGGVPGAARAALDASRRRWVPLLADALASGELVSPLTAEDIAHWIGLTELSLFTATDGFGLSLADCERYIRAFVVAPLVAPKCGGE